MVLIALAAMAAGACSAAPRQDAACWRAAGAEACLTRLRGAELRAPLVGQRLEHPGSGAHLAESFLPDGAWHADGYRAPLSGTYTIANDEVSMLLAGGRPWRRLVLFKDSAGSLFRGLPDEPERGAWPVVAVSAR